MKAALAEFAQSDSGQFYAAVCDRYGVDPGAAISDDVVAYQLRAAFAVLKSRAEREQADPDLAMERWMKTHGG